MLNFEFEIKFLTPAFIGGAYTGECEFSLKPLKSAMRYWWRQIQDQHDTEELYNREKVIFGYTKHSSSFYINTKDCSCLRQDNSGMAYNPPNNSGQAYLFYSCIGRGSRQPGKKQLILSGSKVVIVFLFTTDDPHIIRQVLFSLWLAQSFSGLGARSRRGAGSFQITPVSIPANYRDEIKSMFDCSANQLLTQITNNGANRLPTIDRYISYIQRHSSFYMNFTNSNRFKVFPGNHADSAEDILNSLGDILKRFRTHRRLVSGPIRRHNFYAEACALHSAGHTNTYTGPDPLQKTSFGLPIIYNFSNPAGGREQFSIKAKPSEHDRRASPLFITVKRNARDRFYANLFILWDRFLPPNENIDLIKREGRTETTVGNTNIPSVSALETFLRSV
jgi:CRISPR-associated protein Cmr1